MIEQDGGRLPPREYHPLETPQGHQSSSLSTKGQGRVVELDFAEARSTLKEVEMVPDGGFARQLVAECKGREIDHVPPRQLRADALQRQLAQRRKVSVEDRGCNHRAMLWRISTANFNPQGFKKRYGMREVCNVILEVLRRSVNCHGFEPSHSMREDLEAAVRERDPVPLQPRVDRGGS